MNNKAEILKMNKTCWDAVAPKFFGVEALPEYGPYTVTEDELNLFDVIKDKKVLEIGCGSGHSLKYMAKHGAKELWGLDLSKTQIDLATETLKNERARLFNGAMEEDLGIPHNYFDIVYSIYAIGWTVDLNKTFRQVYSYLKEGGSFIFSWEHPFYPHINVENNKLFINSAYQEEDTVTFENFKYENHPAMLQRRKMSTYINELISVGFSIEKLVEGEVSSKYEGQTAQYSERYYSLYKTRQVPNTFIIKARKTRR
jgi:ubiquinone/menaquinone biosynthesis C-methylase UbiE